jgi:predicted DNA-binding transcriptional regulator AlpA
MATASLPQTAVAGDRTPTLLIDLKELARLLARSAASLLRDAGAGRIPRPVKIGRSVRWRRTEVEDWITAGCPGPEPAGVR